MTVEYTRDKRCDMFLTLGVCNGPARTDVRDFVLRSPIPGHLDVNVFRLFEQRPLKARSTTRTALAKAGSPRSAQTPAKEVVLNETVEKEPWGSRVIARELGVSIQESPVYLDPYHYMWKAHLSPDIGPTHLLYVSLGGAHGYVT